MGVNVIFVSGGTEGDKAHFSINEHSNEWASNLDEFLNEANSHGIKVIFKTMGNSWGNLFGVYPPEPVLGINGTSIIEAETLIDHLAGNNSLRHNFISDERVIAWSIGNEIDLKYNITLNWCLEISKIIHSFGGKVFIDDPYDSNIQGSWVESMDTNVIEPMLRGYVDYLSIHIYLDSVAAEAQKKQTNVYNAVYDVFHKQLTDYLISGRGTTPMKNLIIGEFGIWHGPGYTGNMNVTFTDDTVNQYYKAVYQCARDLGIRNVFNFDFFAQKDEFGKYSNVVNYWTVDVNGDPISGKRSAMQMYYN
jgi:hypothetical protein